MELPEAAELALEEVRRGGVGYADVRAGQEDGESVDVRDQRVEGVSSGTTRGVGVRVLHDGAWGFAATAQLDPDNIRATARLAIDVAKASQRLASNAGLDETSPPVGDYITPHQRDPFDVPLQEKIAYLLDTTESARQVAGLAFVDATYDIWKRRTVFVSTEGARTDQTILQVGAGFQCWAIGGGEAQVRSFPNSFRGQFTCSGWEDVLALDLPGNAPRHAREAVALLSAPDLPHRENATVILDSSQVALQTHESVGHAVELDRILGMERAFAGTSFVQVGDRDKLRYGSDLISITADATTPKALGSFGWDDEGVAANSAPIIRDGILVGFLTNRETAASIGERSNGTARADSWGTIPLIRMNNVSLHPQEGDFDSIVADTADGVLMKTNRSWSIDDRRVNFQFGLEIAYEVKNGQLGQLYRNPTYAGRTTSFWGSCDALGGESDWRVWGVPNCGKGQPSQVARVAHGAATGRFRATVGVR